MTEAAAVRAGLDPNRRHAEPLGPNTLAARAAYVLRGNDTGTVVTAAPRLYPHMWSWDAAFISMGLAHLNVERAVSELDTLFAAQWRDGMLPHIVYTDDTGYFPGPERWGTDIAGHVPEHVRTSGICQPPVHAIAVHRVLEIARGSSQGDRRVAEEFAARAWPTLHAWHRWLMRYRVADDSGLLAIVHGWESGMDNSPRWDVPYAAVRPGADLPPYARRDLGMVADIAERPTDTEYDRYLWLVEEMRRVAYQPEEVVRRSSFLVGDVFISAVFAVASEVLAELGAELGQPGAAVRELRDWAAAARAAVLRSRDPGTGLARDRDMRSGEWLTERTVAGFSPLLCGGLPEPAERSLLSLLDGPQWTGHPELFAAVPPSVSPEDPGFVARQYWRGPQWPVMAWLLGWSFARRGWPERAAALRSEGLRLTGDGAFGEYYEPFTGQPLGSTSQSWTAAVVLDWLCTP